MPAAPVTRIRMRARVEKRRGSETFTSRWTRGDRVAAMGERTQHKPGTFSWADLTTTDPDAAKQFYGGLFGWELEDMPAGPGMTYSMAKIDGKYVGAMSAQPQQQRDAGVPPAWNSYIT